MLSDDFPEVPKELQPKRLPHTGLDGRAVAALRRKGWEPIDVRLIGGDSDGDRAESLKAMLEGIRLGTIEAPDSNLMRFLELEAKVYGLTSGKSLEGKSKPTSLEEDASLDSILKGFGTSRAWSTKDSEKPTKTKKGRGAPRKRPLKKTAEVE